MVDNFDVETELQDEKVFKQDKNYEVRIINIPIWNRQQGLDFILGKRFMLKACTTGRTALLYLTLINYHNVISYIFTNDAVDFLVDHIIILKVHGVLADQVRLYVWRPCNFKDFFQDIYCVKSSKKQSRVSGEDDRAVGHGA